MNIRPAGTAGLQLTYAVGRFAEQDDSFVINQLGGESPLGGFLCSLGSEYAVHLSPDGSGASLFAGLDITSPVGHGKAWYMRDGETGEVWSPFFAPVCGKADEYEVSYLPGQAAVRCLANKIASTLTIATVPGYPCEIWRVHLENRSATPRTLTFTTYVEPSIGPNLETLFMDKQSTLLMRRPLSAATTGGASSDIVLFHSSTLAPVRFQTEKSEFIGEGRTLRGPQHLDDDHQAAEAESIASVPVAAMTVEIDLPIEGEAEFGFCFGVAGSPEHALSVVHAFAKTSDIAAAVEESRAQWQDLCSTAQVDTPDRALNALVNTWLPYEAYAGWNRQRTAGVCLDPSRAADALRRLYALSASAPELCRENILSFAAGISVLGTYSPDNESQVALPAEELLWLAACTAKYVAESGDLSILDKEVTLRDGPRLTLREHCERIMRVCMAGERSQENRVLHETMRLWLLICEDAGFAAHVDSIENSTLADRPEYPEERSLPRRVRYLQSASQSLAEPPMSEEIAAGYASEWSPQGDAGAACCVYAAALERALGIRASRDGLVIHPRMPESWQECEVTRRFRQDTYHIHIKRAASPLKHSPSIIVDGEPILGGVLPCFGDGGVHEVEVLVS